MLSDSRLPDRFWEKVKPSDSGCWEWTASLNGGYGAFHVGSRRMALAHRVAFVALCGEIPPGRQLDHLCRNRKCVNPEHLEPVSQRENILRGDGPSAYNASKTHCKRGHELTQGNVHEYRRGSGVRRVCRECMRIDSAIAGKKYRERNLEYGRQYRAAHRAELNAKQRAYVARKREESNG